MTFKTKQPARFLQAELLSGFYLLLLAVLTSCSGGSGVEFRQGDRIALVGNALAERMQYHGYLETYLQAAHPAHELVFRNLAFTGDRVEHRPRAHKNFGDADAHLSNVRANVIFAFFGYNESFEEAQEKFGRQLSGWIDHTRAQKYDGENMPRIVLFSPIAHEELQDPALPSGRENNARLKEYAREMAKVAAEKDVVFVDLFEGTRKLYESSEEPLTVNGVHLNEEGNRLVAQLITEELTGSVPDMNEKDLKKLRLAVVNKNGRWFNRYRATDGNDVWGSRSNLHGNFETLQHELNMLDVMTANRDRRIWKLAKGGEEISVSYEQAEDPFWAAWEAWDTDTGIDDSNVPEPQEVKTNFTGEVIYLGGEEAIQKMHVEKGLEVGLFASEERFPEVANPVTVKTDTKGRIWVASWETYPKREPLKEMKDRLVILTDTTGNGVADKATTFARVHNPTGFEFWNGGVIVVSAPNILFLKDTDGDDKADVQIVLMSGIDAADTHHTANNLVYGPDGNIYYQRGVFMLSNVETPWRENYEAHHPGLYRFNPRTFEFDFVVENSPNPHGISFDKWGYQYLTDGTTGRAYQVYLDENSFDIPDFEYFKKRKLLDHTVRPVPGNQLLSSTHFPDEYQQNFLIYNVIGFLGIKRYKLEYNQGVVQGVEAGDLLYSDDPNFRPTSGVVGADGALYISDWQNPLIGHMQHNIRDPKRDHTHGRIYRITAKGRPLQEPVRIDGEPVERLLDLLLHPVNEVRHLVHIELSERESAEVIRKTREWVKQFSPEGEEGAHAMLEALWLHQQHQVRNEALLGQLMASPVEHARIAARRVQWFWEHTGEAAAGTHAHGEDTAGSAEETDGQGAGEDKEDHSAGKTVNLTDKEAGVLTITTIQEKMLYDTKEVVVKAGQPIELTLKNPDFMPHNLVIVTPGAADEVAKMAMDLGGEGFDKQFLPDSPEILHATRLLKEGEEQKLTFTAPEEPGEYPFVCTFPGHSQMMRGIIRVVNE